MLRRKKNTQYKNYLNSDISFVIITIINLLIVTYFYKVNPDLKHSSIMSYNTNLLVYNIDTIVKYLPIFDILLSLLLSIGLGINIFFSLNKLLNDKKKKHDIYTWGYYLGLLSPTIFIITFYIFISLNMPYNYTTLISPKFLCYGLYLICNIIVIAIISNNILKNKKNFK